MGRIVLSVLLVSVLSLRPLPAQTEAKAKRLNVLLLVADDLRPGLINALGHGEISTPNLDLLVRGGTALRNATCAYPLCVPSRAEMLSGRTSFRNGFLSKGSLQVNGPATWAETMRRAGYRTYYVGKWHTSGRPSTRGYDEAPGLFAAGMKPDKAQVDHAGRIVTGYVGWMFQSDDGKKLFPQRGVGLTPKISEEFAKETIGVVRRKHDAPFFLHVNFTAPHDPRLFPPGFEKKYAAAKVQLPKNFRAEHPFDHGNLKGRDEKLLNYPREAAEVRAELAAYYAVVSHLDEQIGKILAALRESGLEDSTLVIFTSDHGLALGSHGLVGKQNMYEHTINVPLLFRGPGIPANQVRDAGCYLRDLYPTVCNLAGIKELPAELDGKSLVSVLRGDEDQVYPFITGYFDNTQRMIRRGRWKFIVYPLARREQLFDLQTDPDEMKDLAADPVRAALQRELREQMIAWFAAQGDHWAKGQAGMK